MSDCRQIKTDHVELSPDSKTIFTRSLFLDKFAEIENGKTLQRSAYPVQVSIGRIGHIIVDNDVDTLNVNASSH